MDITIADNGKSAVELVKRYHVALILMDIHMPEMDGFEATRLIREAEAELGRRTTIVAATASDTREHCMDAGVDDYLAKPADYSRIAQQWLPDSARRLA